MPVIDPSLLPGLLQQLQSPSDAATQQGLSALPAAAPLVQGPSADAIPTPANAPAPVANFTPPTADPTGSTQAPADPTSGLLSSFTSAVGTAAQDPGTSQGLLGAFGDKFQQVGQRLKSLSPAASQGLLATGLSILANNNGSQNLGQVLAGGSINGLNTYNDVKAQQQAAAFRQQQLSETSRQNQFNNAIAAGKLNNDTTKPTVVSDNSSLYDPVTKTYSTPPTSGRVATYQDQVQPDGSVAKIGLDASGRPVAGAVIGNTKNPNVGPLDTSAQKTVNDAQLAAQSAVTQYKQTQDLATKLADPKNGFIGGVPASFNDFTTKIFGNKDASQQLRGQLAQFANSSILGELPPGSASDKDIALVRNGIPSDTSNAQTWQSYLSAVGRVQQAAAVTQSAKADYAASNRGSLGPLQQAATINGIQYPAGTSYADAISGKAPVNVPTYSPAFISSAKAELAARGVKH